MYKRREIQETVRGVEGRNTKDQAYSMKRAYHMNMTPHIAKVHPAEPIGLVLFRTSGVAFRNPNWSALGKLPRPHVSMAVASNRVAMLNITISITLHQTGGCCLLSSLPFQTCSILGAAVESQIKIRPGCFWVTLECMHEQKRGNTWLYNLIVYD